MCVILACDVSRPTEEMVRNSWASNPDGGGLSWHGISADGSPTVKWRKGLNLSEMLEASRTTPLPFIMHFRVASIGGVVDELTHPFPLDDDVPLWLEGDAPNGVLFHNGHWNGWKDQMRDAIFRSGLGLRLPYGYWSDSRAMAFIAHHFGWGVLDWIDGGLAHRIAIMAPPTPDNPEGIWLFGKWPDKISGPKEKGGGVVASNESWRSKGFRKGDPTYTQPPASMAGGGSSGGAKDPVKSAKDSATILLGPGGTSAGSPPSSPVPSASGSSGTITGVVSADSLTTKVLRRLRRNEEKKRKKEERRVDRLLEAEVRVLHRPPVH